MVTRRRSRSCEAFPFPYQDLVVLRFVMKALRDRFEAFIKTFDGFEDIDTMLKSNDPIRKNRADYLLRRREIIVEQKSLDVDPVSRPQNYANKLMAQGRLIAFGTVSTRMFSE